MNRTGFSPRGMWYTTSKIIHNLVTGSNLHLLTHPVIDPVSLLDDNDAMDVAWAIICRMDIQGQEIPSIPLMSMKAAIGLSILLKDDSRVKEIFDSYGFERVVWKSCFKKDMSISQDRVSLIRNLGIFRDLTGRKLYLLWFHCVHRYYEQFRTLIRYALREGLNASKIVNEGNSTDSFACAFSEDDIHVNKNDLAEKQIMSRIIYQSIPIPLDEIGIERRFKKFECAQVLTYVDRSVPSASSAYIRVKMCNSCYGLDLLLQEDAEFKKSSSLFDILYAMDLFEK